MTWHSNPEDKNWDQEYFALIKENHYLRSTLQRIVDNGEQSGYAYGVAFAALQNIKETA